MMEEIMGALRETEEARRIKILFACETGSRAWGFPSPDSDYDVRFIYMHDKDWYLQLGKRKDSIEMMNGDLDITGWDLRKSLLLLKKSNTSLIERFQSPVLYYAAPGFSEGFKGLISQYYSARAVYFHHYSLAEKFWEEIKDKRSFKLKSYFYLLRSLLSCNWITSDNDVPPMHMEALMKYISPEDRRMVVDLIQLKAGVGESYLHDSTDEQRRLITDLFDTVKSKGDHLPVCREDFHQLDSFFIQQLDGTDYK